eukprot:143902-Alexandrium_andersonii.AAC.1
MARVERLKHKFEEAWWEQQKPIENIACAFAIAFQSGEAVLCFHGYGAICCGFLFKTCGFGDG